MKLLDYKLNKGGTARTWAEVGGPFGLEAYQVFRLAKRGAKIRGPKGKKQIYFNLGIEVVAQEGEQE